MSNIKAFFRGTWKRSDRRYFLVGLLMGSLYVVCVPPFQTPDEPNHFYRCYQICSGHLISEKRGNQCGGLIPRSIVADVNESSGNVAFHQDQKETVDKVIGIIEEAPPRRIKEIFVDFPNTALYSPIPYLPQAIGVLPAKWLKLSPLLLMYAGRFANLIFTLAVCSFAIRITPTFASVVFLMGLAPMFVYEAASLSPDAATNALSILLTVYILRCAFGEKEPEHEQPSARQVRGRDLYVIAALAILLGFCKSAYCALALLYFVIPQERVGSRRKYYLAGAAAVGLSFAASLFWMSRIKGIYVPYLPGGWPDLTQPRVFITAHPLLFSKMILWNLGGYLRFYIVSFVGYLGWLDTRLPLVLIIAFLVALCGAAVYGNQPRVMMTARQRAIFGLVAFFGAALVVTGQFFIWTEAGSDHIRPAQGRHFIPYALPVLLLACNRRLGVKVAQSRILSVALVIAVTALLVALWVVIRRYYV